MKRILTIAVSLFVISASCFAQEAPAQKKHNGERAQAEKIGYITQRLQLTPEEAQVFWPVYNESKMEGEAVRKEFFKTFKDLL